MDKHPQNQKIKIKINGKERPINEDMTIHDWKSAKEETAVGAETKDEQFDWILPDIDENQIQEFKKINYTKKSTASFPNKLRKNPNKQVTKLFLSIITAVSIGVLIGLFMLKVVIYQSNITQKAHSTSTQNENPTQKNNSGKTAYIQIPALTAAVIQGGIYKNPEPIVQSIKQKGLPAVVLPISNQQYIYIGVAGDLQSAKNLAKQYEKKGVAVFAKELTIEGKSIPIQSNDEKKFISASIPLFQLLSKEIANSYLTGDTDKDAFGALKTKLTEITNLKDIKNKQLELMKNIQIQSFQTLTAFQSNQDKQELIKAQTSLLSYLQEINKLE
ncbi:hypothetical protein [Heyndrickxia vini]|uniref:SPOR domain-containing protein n=1 Tax=Heyndrickxia vini TaxID=1476025 RepID=A0ABX7E5Z2_9BACI|nr:hypothetical protein [Heyndrickxia vini]QQZ10714.1 hypothetical protein I5776_07405 [Heyndrickxia vini]